MNHIQQIRNFEIEWSKLALSEGLEKNGLLQLASKKSSFSDSLKTLKEITHSLKGLSRALDEDELSKTSHALEGCLFKVEKMVLNSSPINKETEERFFSSFGKIKDKCRQTYLQSPQFESISLKNQHLLPLFFRVFEFTEVFVSSELKNLD